MESGHKPRALALGYLTFVVPSHIYQTGNPPDVFWNAFYLLVALAALVKLRLTQRTQAASEGMPGEALEHPAIQRNDLKEVFRVLAPFVAALLTCAVIAVQATIAPLVPSSPSDPV